MNGGVHSSQMRLPRHGRSGVVKEACVSPPVLAAAALSHLRSTASGFLPFCDFTSCWLTFRSCRKLLPFSHPSVPVMDNALSPSHVVADTDRAVPACPWHYWRLGARCLRCAFLLSSQLLHFFIGRSAQLPEPSLIHMGSYAFPKNSHEPKIDD